MWDSHLGYDGGIGARIWRSHVGVNHCGWPHIFFLCFLSPLSMLVGVHLILAMCSHCPWDSPYPGLVALFRTWVGSISLLVHLGQSDESSSGEYSMDHLC